MLVYRILDLTTVECGIVAHGCNCQGRMGIGLARSIRQHYPEVFSEYDALCAAHEPEELLGRVQLVSVSQNLVIANCFTQLRYGRDRVHADAEAIQSSLQRLCDWAKSRREWRTIFLPKIGCGYGGLDWGRDVGPRVQVLAEMNGVDFVVASES